MDFYAIVKEAFSYHESVFELVKACDEKSAVWHWRSLRLDHVENYQNSFDMSDDGRSRVIHI